MHSQTYINKNIQNYRLACKYSTIIHKNYCRKLLTLSSLRASATGTDCLYAQQRFTTGVGEGGGRVDTSFFWVSNVMWCAF